MERLDDIGALARLAADTDGCLTVAQLRAQGYGGRAVTTLVRRGILRRVFIGVYAMATAALTHQQAIRAALLAAGPNAHVSGRTALELRGLAKPDRAGRIWITVVGGQRRPLRMTMVPLQSTGRPAIVHVLRATGPLETEHHGGLPTTSIPRALVDAAARETTSMLRKIVREADFHEQLDAGTLADELDRRRHGSKALRNALPAGPLAAEFTGSADSRAAHRLLRGLLDRGIVPTRVDRPLRVGMVECRPDFWFLGEQLVVEADGPHHEHPERKAEDEARDAALREHGIETMRIETATIRAALSRCVDDVAAVLSRRAATRHRRAVPRPR
ncbi:MAG: AbiEi antitoxin N-terminal domain-containing protein [Patulibacter minatonensis]